MLSKRFKKSFTLIEVLIATLIFVIFAGSVIALFSLNSKNTVVNKHRLEAANLAREGIDLVSQVRETALLKNEDKDWTSGCWNINNGTKILTYGTYGTYGSCVNTWRLENQADQKIYFNEEDSTISDTSSVGSIEFTRAINVEDAEPPGNKKITVSVSWEDYDIIRSIRNVTYLSRWQ
ncbi:hypothetical protein A2V71_04280 [Candidatus Berkelbacteria bacterium RBG_13_40_8]|uniref:Type II secretion system protein n=1 Tax=Candidatus Berkelbacteria bacterium RBG_13_40_8 TaxID=1797467 RepID=A0A1F5DNY9_9BACT|nr:MAG: hypothetical protein A2V71_04280 [Candidatus Berkelbacteria bacterium RBG_13_40_8]